MGEHLKSLENSIEKAHYKRFSVKVLNLHEIIANWYRENKRYFPWRDDIHWKQGLITELLLQRTRATKVEEVFHILFEKYPDFHSLCSASKEELAEMITILGLQEQRSTRLIQIACEFKDKKDDPSLELLKASSGVGDYVANATLCFYLDQSRPLLDTNFRRVYSRYFDVDIPLASKQKKAYEFIRKIVPEKNCDTFSYGILDLAFYICTFNNPKCKSCPLSSFCSLGRKNIKKQK